MNIWKNIPKKYENYMLRGVEHNTAPETTYLWFWLSLLLILLCVVMGFLFKSSSKYFFLLAYISLHAGHTSFVYEVCGRRIMQLKSRLPPRLLDEFDATKKS